MSVHAEFAFCLIPLYDKGSAQLPQLLCSVWARCLIKQDSKHVRSLFCRARRAAAWLPRCCGWAAFLPAFSRRGGRRWEPQSYGYHGDDGKKYHANGHGDDYGPTFSTGDVVGAGVHLDRQEIFFTCAALVLCLFQPPNSVAYLVKQGNEQ